MSIRKCFTSRYDGGLILEADYDQLEVRVLAYLSNDQQLIYDLNNGVDVHSTNAAKLFGWESTAEFEKALVDGSSVAKYQRRAAKTLSFQLQYGSGARNMAEQSGVSLRQARTFIANYYERYPGVAMWQECMLKEVNSNCEPTRRLSQGLPVSKSVITNVTGRKLTFYEVARKDWKTGNLGTGFVPPEVKNYPVQSLATGDIVPIALGLINRFLLKFHQSRTKLVINTVHDSILFDINRRCLFTRDYTSFKSGLEHVMTTQVYTVLKECFHIDLPVELPVTFTEGVSWEDC